MNHQSKGNNGDIAALAHDGGFAEVDEVFFLGHRSLHGHQLAMFEEEHGVIAGERGFEQAFRIAR